MFKAFGKERVSGHTQLKASVQRSIRGTQHQYLHACCIFCCSCVLPASPSSPPPTQCHAAAKICEQYPWLEESGVIDQILPKKVDLTLVKLPEHVQLLVLANTPLFFSTRDGGWFPTLRVLHQYPDIMPKLRCDQGAIKFVLGGANIMCPGLTSPGATIHDEVRVWMCAPPIHGCVRPLHAGAASMHSLPAIHLLVAVLAPPPPRLSSSRRTCSHAPCTPKHTRTPSPIHPSPTAHTSGR